MPFQGESMTTLSPRAMPWANRSLAFQAVLQSQIAILPRATPWYWK